MVLHKLGLAENGTYGYKDTVELEYRHFVAHLPNHNICTKSTSATYNKLLKM